MAPADTFFLIASVGQKFYASHGTPASNDVLSYALAGIGILATVVISVWQQRRAERTRPEFRDLEYAEARAILTTLEDLESKARKQGPLDKYVINAADLDGIQRQLENVSRRCPQWVRDTLMEVAASAARFNAIKYESDGDAKAVDADKTTHDSIFDLRPDLLPGAMGGNAIRQYRAAADLDQLIQKAWRVLSSEHNGGSWWIRWRAGRGR